MGQPRKFKAEWGRNATAARGGSPGPARRAWHGVGGRNNGKIAFVSKQNGGDEDIWLINPDGTGAADISQNLTRDVDPAFSPDGSKIAFARFISDRNFDLFVMNSDGTGERQITSTTASERFPSWSPDGKHLVYRKNVRNGKFDIWTLALGPTGPGTAAVNIVRDSPENDYDPEWSPDGTSIAFVSERFGVPNPEIMVANSDGTDVRRLTNNAVVDKQPSWLPDASAIVFTTLREGNPAIYRMRPDGTGQVRMIPGTVKDDYPAPSPDGSKIAFRRSLGSVDMWIANAGRQRGSEDLRHRRRRDRRSPGSRSRRPTSRSRS